MISDHRGTIRYLTRASELVVKGGEEHPHDIEDMVLHDLRLHTLRLWLEEIHCLNKDRENQAWEQANGFHSEEGRCIERSVASRLRMSCYNGMRYLFGGAEEGLDYALWMWDQLEYLHGQIC